MRVTVCIPTFNSERHLAAAIESVLAQTYRDFVLVLSDDLSTDSTLEICRKYAQLDGRVFVSQESAHVGLFRNYNRCMANARGDYIKLLAHDDLLEADALSEMVAVLDEHHDVAVVGCKRKLIDENGHSLGFAAAFDRGGKIDGATAIHEALTKLDNNIGDPTCMLFRRSLIDTGFNPAFVYLNLEFWCRLFMQGSYYHINTPLCSQRQHSGQRGNVLLDSLLYISDYQLLMDECRHMLVQAGLEEQEWRRRLTEVMTDHVNFRLVDKSLSADDCALAASMLIDNADVASISHGLQRYASLNYWTMYRLSQALGTVHKVQGDKQAQAEEITYLRSEIDALRQAVDAQKNQLQLKALSRLPVRICQKVSRLFDQLR